MPDKRYLDEDENAYKILAMLFEPIVSEAFFKLKEEQLVEEDEEGPENTVFAQQDKELAQFAPTPLLDHAQAVGNPRDANCKIEQ